MTNETLHQIWPEWDIEGAPLGKGSYGTVYKAVRSDEYMQSYSAIKALSIPTDSSEIDSLRAEGLDYNASYTFLRGVVADFVNEIKLMTSLKGAPNIVNVEDYKVVEKTDELGWNIYIRMELLTPFNAYFNNHGFSEADVIRLGCDICSALEVCEQQNVIHRDIKPENIFINDFGDFKLGDFGIARKLENMTGGLSQKGTFYYMAPEVAQGRLYDNRVDLYSLGLVLYRLLNQNRLPFIENEMQLMNPNDRKAAVDRRLRGDIISPPCNASPELAQIVLRACAYEPEKRFGSAAEMKQALLKLKNGNTSIVQQTEDSGTISLRKPQPATAPASSVGVFGDSQPTRRSRWVLGCVAAGVLCAVLMTGLIFFLASREDTDSSDSAEETSITTTTTAQQDENTTTAIRVVQQPQDVFAPQGEYAVAVVETDRDDLAYVWWVSDPGDSQYYKSSLATNVYFIEMTAENDGRKAYCVITDPEGNAVTTETVTLKIGEPNIQLGDVPTAVVASKGDYARVTVAAEGEGLTYEWWVSDPGDTKYYRSSNVTDTYKVEMTDVTNGRKAICVVRDEHGNAVGCSPVEFVID